MVELPLGLHLRRSAHDRPAVLVDPTRLASDRLWRLRAVWPPDFAEYPFFTRLLDGDPSGLPRERWLWEAGAAYAITEATGDLAAFAGGTAHVLGLEVPRVLPPQCLIGVCPPPPPTPTIGVPIVLVAPESATPDPSSPLVERAAGPDGQLGTQDDTVLPLGFAYGVVPEPGADALATAAFVSLVALAQPIPRLRRMRGSGASVSGSKAPPVTCS